MSYFNHNFESFFAFMSNPPPLTFDFPPRLQHQFSNKLIHVKNNCYHLLMSQNNPFLFSVMQHSAAKACQETGECGEGTFTRCRGYTDDLCCDVQCMQLRKCLFVVTEHFAHIREVHLCNTCEFLVSHRPGHKNFILQSITFCTCKLLQRAQNCQVQERSRLREKAIHFLYQVKVSL